MQIINLTVKGMHCRSCEMLIEQDLIETGAVNSVTANNKTEIVKIEFDETKISIDQMSKIINALGFEAQNS